MRRTLVTLAIVLGVAVLDVEAQEHGAKAPEHGAKAPEHGAKAPEHGAKAPEHGAKAPEHGAKAPEHGAKAAEHGAKAPATAVAAKPVVARSQRDLVALAERIHEKVAVVTSASRAKAGGHSSRAPEPRAESTAGTPPRAELEWPTAHSRVELEWRVPLVAWPEELLRPDAPSTR